MLKLFWALVILSMIAVSAEPARAILYGAAGSVAVNGNLLNDTDASSCVLSGVDGSTCVSN